MSNTLKEKVIFLREEFADGEGTFKYPNGNKYAGQWKNGEKNGNGVLKVVDLGNFEGQWKDGEQHGEGSLTFENGYKITGEWRFGSPFKGTASWPNGNKYEGEFKDWKWHGQGKFSVPDGHHIIGEFREHKPWQTIEYDKNGMIVGKIVGGVQTIENSSQITPELEIDVPV